MPTNLSRAFPSFCIAFLSAMLFPIYLPFLKIVFFAPFLVISFYRYSFYAVLWLSLLSGMIMDVISSQPYFGLHCLSYVFSSLILYWQKKNFFQERQSTLFIMTSLFSFLSTAVQLALQYLFAQSIHISWKLLGTDLCIMPFIDGIYGFIGFAFPYYILFKIKNLGNAHDH